jgi:hypothetical protein
MRFLALIFAPACLLAACGPSSEEGACKDNLIAGDLVITEVFADFKPPPGGSGEDEGKEWVEIYNASDRPVTLEGMTVVHSRPDDTKQEKHVMGNITIAPGQYFTLGNATSDLIPPYIDYGYAADLGGLYNSDGGKFALKCGDSEIDSAVYESVKSGKSRQLTSGQPPDYTLNDDQVNWCEAGDTEFEAGNFGTPGSDNDCTPVIIGQCNDNGTMRDAVLPMPGDAVITEVMPNPAVVSDAAGEWFEIQAVNPFDLNGVALDRAGDTTNPRPIESADCVHLTAGSYAVFAKNADMAMNGGLPAGTVLTTFTFALVDGTTAEPADVQLVVGSTVIDKVTWTSTRSGRSHALDPDLTDPIANDTEGNFCDGSTPYGPGDNLGTPGAVNDQCTLLPPAGMCDDAGTIRAIVKPAAGAVVITEVMINPIIETPAGPEWFEIKNTSGTAFDLNELGLDRVSDTRLPDVIASPTCKSVAPGGYALFARSADPLVNGGLMTVDATFGITMPNTAGDVRVMDGDTVLDAVTWGSVSAAMYDGKSLALDPDSETAAANDTPIPMPPWCVGTTEYGTLANYGTPRMANAQCP